MNTKTPLRVYFVMGEESGDVLGSDLLDSFAKLGVPVEPMGLGGSRMKAKGLESLFDISQLSVMGISSVIPKLPALLNRIRQTAKDVIEKQPDILLLIDSPEFSYRVAKKVRKQSASPKIVKYVAPTVWAWRPGRAAKIAKYIDHILAVLPFEPEVMEQLSGPKTTYIGHPLAAAMPRIDKLKKRDCADPVKLVMLPGSRLGETRRLMPVFEEILQILKSRDNHIEITLPTLSRLEPEIREQTRNWAYTPNIVIGDDARREVFKSSDLALAASGTVTLELSLYKVPMIAVYKLDPLMLQMRRFISAWTASLPNLIADYPVVPERLNEDVRAGSIARMLERLMVSGPERNAQLEGFELIAKRMKQETPSGQLAAQKILEIIEHA